MTSRNKNLCVATMFAALGLSAVSWGQTPAYPAYVVDAQQPIVSSDGFNAPRGLAVAPGGAVYVADAGNHRVLKFAGDGT
jgi:glucose/arabinose dehydrogenase